MLKHFTGFAPFNLMFGRKCDVTRLLAIAKYPNDLDSTSAETLAQADDVAQAGDVIECTATTPPEFDAKSEELYSFASDPHEWVNDHMNERSESFITAKKRIKEEQSRQKTIYDKKVKSNR